MLTQTEEGLQQVVVAVLQALRKACSPPSGMLILDTHSSGYLQDPIAKIDISGVASTASGWLGLIVAFELKLKQTASYQHAVVHQLQDRCRHACNQQQHRQHMFGAAIYPDAVEVLCFTPANGGGFSVRHLGPCPLAVSPESPGLQLLARILLASKEQLGYSLPSLEQPITFRGETDRQLWEPQLISIRRDVTDSRSIRQRAYAVRLDAKDGPKAALRLATDGHEVSSSATPCVAHVSRYTLYHCIQRLHTTTAFICILLICMSCQHLLLTSCLNQHFTVVMIAARCQPFAKSRLELEL